MKPLILFICASALATIAGAVPLCTISPGSWCEAAVGDAGGFIANAEATKGTGALNSIIGNIGNGTAGTDLYSILIENPAQFSATLAAYTSTGYTGETNAALYLFDATGHGIEAASEGTALSSFVGPAGYYFVGVVPNGNLTEYTANGASSAVFNPFVNGQDSLPVAGSSALDKYSQDGCGTSCTGAYEVTLNGAQYSNLPEPGSLALFGVAFSTVSLIRRFKSTKLL